MGRCGRAEVGLPGGCNLGPRPMDQHIKGFEALGATVETSQGKISASAKKLKGASVYMDVASVGATINTILAAVLAEGTTIIDNAAKEPHIVDVANFLNTMGADIRGAGTDLIKINGVMEETLILDDFYNKLSLITMDEVVSYRYLKRLYTVFDPIKENIDELDFRKAEKYIENLWGSREVLTDKTYEKHLDHLLNIVWDIMINSKEVLMKDALSQSYYLKLLYETGAMQAENIEQYEEQAKAMYFCLMGKYKAIDQKQYEEAIKYFRKYFCIIQKNDFEKTLADTPYYKESATYWTGVCYYELFEFEEAKKYFLKCQELTENNHKKAAQYIEKINR